MAGIAEYHVEEAALAWLEEQGFAAGAGPDFGPDGSMSERASYGEVVLAVRLREAIYRDVVHVAATRPENIERLANLADGHGGACPAVKPIEVSDTGLVLPGEKVLTAFADIISPFRAKTERAKVENQSLAQTCELLLPKLMSGEIRLREAEKQVEAVA